MITKEGKFKLVGYGPSGLLDKVKKAGWVDDLSIGHHFKGIKFGHQNRALFSEEDDVACLPMVISITGEGDTFCVDGWTNLESIFVAIAATERRCRGSAVFGKNWGGSIQLAGTILAKHPTPKKMIPYEIEINLHSFCGLEI